MGACKDEHASPGGSVVKNPPVNAGDEGDADLILGSGRSPGGGNDNPFRCSCWENPMDRGATESGTIEHMHAREDEQNLDLPNRGKLHPIQRKFPGISLAAPWFRLHLTVQGVRF